MRRAARKLLWLLPTLSLLLCLAVCVLWATSYRRAHVVTVTHESWPEPNVWRSRGVGLRLVQGHWLAWWGGNDFHVDRPAGIVAGWGPMDAEQFRADHPGGLRW